MADQLSFLIKELETTDIYDRENALLDLYIFLISKNRSLPRQGNTFIFVELSKWRDFSLRDGVEAYYDAKETNELAQLEEVMKKHTNQEACRKCLSGIRIYQEKGDFASLDNWIFNNESSINDFLVELTRQ